MISPEDLKQLVEALRPVVEAMVVEAAAGQYDAPDAPPRPPAAAQTQYAKRGRSTSCCTPGIPDRRMNDSRFGCLCPSEAMTMTNYSRIPAARTPAASQSGARDDDFQTHTEVAADVAASALALRTHYSKRAQHRVLASRMAGQKITFEAALAAELAADGEDGESFRELYAKGREAREMATGSDAAIAAADRDIEVRAAYSKAAASRVLVKRAGGEQTTFEDELFELQSSIPVRGDWRRELYSASRSGLGQAMHHGPRTAQFSGGRPSQTPPTTAGRDALHARLDLERRIVREADRRRRRGDKHVSYEDVRAELAGDDDGYKHSGPVDFGVLNAAEGSGLRLTTIAGTKNVAAWIDGGCKT